MESTASLQEAFENRWTNLLFFTGKILRLAMSLLFLFVIRSSIKTIGGYTSDQMVLFFLVYLWLDTLAQAVFRGVYLFGNTVRQGNFDFDLARPINPLFRALTGEPDINDVIFLIPSCIVTIWIVVQLHLQFSFHALWLFGLLFINGLVIATALHIFVLSIALLTTDVDGIVWMYRDLLKLGQFPVSLYKELMSFALFFLVPIGMMITIPTEVLLNVQPSHALWLTVLVSVVSVGSSLLLWHWSLRQYTSASS